MTTPQTAQPYRLATLLAGTRDGPQFLACLWNRENGHYLQTIDDCDIVTGFRQFGLGGIGSPELIIEYEKRKESRPGLKAVHGFRFSDGRTIAATRKHLAPMLEEEVRQLADLPVTKVRVLEFLNAYDRLPEAIEEASERLFRGRPEHAQRWRTERLNYMTWQRSRPRPGLDTAFPGWSEVSAAYLSGLPPMTTDDLLRYFRGAAPDWRLIASSRIDCRDVVAKARSRLLDHHDGFCALLLTGAAGEGKSTALMQTGLDLLQAGFRVLLTVNGAGDPMRPLADGGSAPLALLIDDADELNRPDHVLRTAAKRPGPTRLVLASRTSEWRGRQGRAFNGRSTPQLANLEIGALSPSEAMRLGSRVVASGALGAIDAETFAARLRNAEVKDLLVAMLLATAGKQLTEILRDWVRKIATLPDGDLLLDIVAVITALDSRADRRGGFYPATRALLRETLNLSDETLDGALWQLGNEISLSRMSGQHVRCRHPRIASELAKALFRGDDAPFDAFGLDQAIITAAGALSNGQGFVPERPLLTVIPRFWDKRGDRTRAGQLFAEAARAEPNDAVIWQAWALLEAAQGNVGTVETPHSARWLFRHGTEADPKNAPTWQAWALLEADQGNTDLAQRLSRRSAH